MKHYAANHFNSWLSPLPAPFAPDMEDSEQQVRAAEDRARFYKDALDEAAIVAVTDAKGTILSVNGKFCELSGFSEAELIGANHRILRSGVHDRNYFQHMYRTIARGDVWHGEICNRAKNGKFYWVDTTIVPHRGCEGRIESYTAIRFDITPQKVAEERLWRLANIDALTGLPNRLKFMRDLDEIVADRVNHVNGIVVALMDIDHFKDINDSFGHPAGDELLREVGNRIRAALDEGDIIARLGGDEFALIFRNCPTRADKDARVARIFASLAAPMTICDSEQKLSASLGATRFPEEGLCGKDLLKNADIALYSAKAKGRNRAEMFSERMRNVVQRRAELRNRVEAGLRNCEFLVEYQPIVPVSSTTPICMEALLRWRDPRAGRLEPESFAEALNDEGLAALVDAFVLEEVLTQIRAWRMAKIPFGSISVNTTLGDFRTAAYVDRILLALVNAEIEKEDLCIEITEGMVLGRGGSRARVEIERLHVAGFRIAFDDFGTGFASLRHLRDLPIDLVKIDKSFIRSLEDDQADRAVVTSIIELAHRLGKKVTAEGVETNAQAAILELLGCDNIQGYLMSRPLPAEEVPAFLTRPSYLAA